MTHRCKRNGDKRCGFTVEAEGAKFSNVFSSGFTLIETLVAIALITTAIVAPMALTSQSLQTAYYARDQVTAFYLAQEAIEALRSVRDGQILQIAQSQNASSIDIFGVIPLEQNFTVDAREAEPSSTIVPCSGGQCPALQTDADHTLYGYETGWTDTTFTRTVRASEIGNDEIRITVTVSWQSGGIQRRSFSISENMYRWVQDGSSLTE